ncbi:MAG: 4-carboxy-4-hydroxy-2-oxoadipate aldolase/oxaloacetate decarboxylase [Acidobacteria bacterium]|nr:4-carboxy-4-hydroxy-2-oxoadipate aldolase/oxaloacetate decarboxylase [Acidobacteriota bacterium]
MKNVVIRNIQRADAALIEALGAQGSATVSEAQERTGLMQPYMRPIYPTARVAGSAITVLCHPGDNIMIHAAIEICQPGDVLIVATTSSSTCGMFGELMGTSCQTHNIRGLIVDAGIRDVAELTTMGFPVWAKAISAQGPLKAVPGSVNVEIVCAGVTVRPGDVVVGDTDGVVIVPREHAAEVARIGQERVEREEQVRARLKAGEYGVNFQGLRAKLIEMGVEYVDE